MSGKVMSKIVGAIIVITMVALIGASGFYFYRIGLYQSIVAEISVSTPDLRTVADGTHHGSFDALEVAATVAVSVENHKITAITILHHKNDRGHTAEVITDKVIAAQSLEVDTISGATNSSKVLLKAIEAALEQGS